LGCLQRPSFYVTRALLSPSTEFLCHPQVTVSISLVSKQYAPWAVSIDQVSMSPARWCLHRPSFYVTSALLSPSTEFLCHPQVAVCISRVSKPYAPWAVSIDPVSMLSVRCYLRYTLYSTLLTTFQDFATLYNLCTFNYTEIYSTCLFLQLISLKVRHSSFSQGIE
jgi:ABC-type polysaccharide/polyol phosphate export permease